MNSAMYAIKVTLEIIGEEPRNARKLWVNILCATFTDDFGETGAELRDEIRKRAKDALSCPIDSWLVTAAGRAHRDLF